MLSSGSIDMSLNPPGMIAELEATKPKDEQGRPKANPLAGGAVPPEQRVAAEPRTK